MSKYVVAEIDKKVCKGECASLDTAMRRVVKYIKQNIDPSFSADAFNAWLRDGSEKPFKWGKNTYHWS